MKDNGKVFSTKEDIAQVEVNCLLESCHDCSARTFCTGKAPSKRLLTVKNPLNATPGDEVEIEIPETGYNKVLILIFGILLIAALLGMGAGYFFSTFISLSPSQSSVLGLFLGLSIAGWGLFRFFRKKNKEGLYPIITDIIKKGDRHG